MSRRTAVVLYPGCIPYEVMLAVELLGPVFPVAVFTPDGAPHVAEGGWRTLAEGPYADAAPGDFACVLVPGGDPASILEDASVDDLLRGALEAGAWIGAICAGPLLLAKAGLLRGRAFTHGYGDAHRDVLDPYWEGASFVDAPVVIDGRVVTAQPWAHIAFGVTLAEKLGVVTPDRAADRLRFYGGERS